MSQLRNIQQHLQSHLLTNDDLINAQVFEPSQGSVADRLAIYNNGYRWRLYEILDIYYPILAKVMGAEAFEKLRVVYLEIHPSRHYSIDLFGQYLPEFLKTAAPYNQQLFLSELAQFIWSLSDTIDGPDAPVLVRDDLAAVAQDQWPDMRISLHPSVALLTQRWNTLALWNAANADQPIPAAELLEQETYCVVWRKEIQSYFNVLGKEDAWILQALQKDLSFGEICEGLLQWLPEDAVAAHAVNILLRWLQDGMLSTVRIEP